MPTLGHISCSRESRTSHSDIHADFVGAHSNDNLTDCVNPDPSNTLTDRLNIALNSSGSGFRLRLCLNTTYAIQAPILFAAQNQEISTVGLPVESENGTDLRATLLVNGPMTDDGTGHTTAVDGKDELDMAFASSRFTGSMFDVCPLHFFRSMSRLRWSYS